MRTTEYKQYVGAGWASLLDMMDDELLALYPDYSVAQVKEKFGRLTVYLEDYPEPLREDLLDLLDEYYMKSEQVCERCGMPGRIRTDRMWVKTACDDCAPLRPWGLTDVKADDDGT